jgi:hypothetical protein
LMGWGKKIFVFATSIVLIVIYPLF